MSNHTPGEMQRVPAIGGWWLSIGCQHLAFISRYYHNSHPEQNALRLAACWNACIGLGTSKIEDIAKYRPVAVVEVQRERLYAALIHIKESLVVANEQGSISDTLWAGDSETLFDYIDAAIEQATVEV